MQGGYAGWPPSFVGRLADGDAAAYADAIGRLALAVFAYLEFTDAQTGCDACSEPRSWPTSSVTLCTDRWRVCRCAAESTYSTRVILAVSRCSAFSVGEPSSAVASRSVR